VDDLYDHMAMSFYSTITDVSESPVADGELWVGTDDGLVQHSPDGGATWAVCGELPGLAERAFVNDVEACLHRSGACFVAADDHKNGDYTPYLYETVDGGQTWRSIRGDLPDGVIVWQIEQDHIDPALLFVGAENGLYVSLDGGDHWHRMGQGDSPSMPTIAVRDLAIQRRDDDLVAATFGRGFYVLDDYSPLRGMSTEALAAPATMFPIRPAWRYVPHQRMQAEGQPTLGSTAFRTDNPPFGAVVTYHLSTAIETARSARLAAENDTEGDVPFPGFATLTEERLETTPVVQLVVRDADGAVVRRLDAPHTAGLHRVAWDLRRPAHDPVNLTKPEFVEPWVDDPVGPLCAAGTYTVELVRLLADGTAESLAGPESVDVVDVATQADGDDGTAFGAEIDDLRRRIAGAAKTITTARDRLTHLRVALAAAPGASPELVGRLNACHRSVEGVAAQLTGDPVLADLHEPPSQSVKGLADRAGHFHLYRTGAPTQTQRAAAARAAAEFVPLGDALDAALTELAELTEAVDEAGGTWTPR
ncbi:MAG: glycosyl hydrolase, partial [Acidimicrobiales bacterium]